MKKRYVEIKLSALANTSISDLLSKNGFKAGTFYEVFGIAGDKIIIMNELGDLMEVYPRYLRVEL